VLDRSGTGSYAGGVGGSSRDPCDARADPSRAVSWTGVGGLYTASAAVRGYEEVDLELGVPFARGSCLSFMWATKPQAI